MAWWIEALQVSEDGKPTGRWRMTATSDEDGGGPFGDTSHDHPSAEEAQACERCDEFVSSVAGFPSRQRQAGDDERRDSAEFDRLKTKFGES